MLSYSLMSLLLPIHCLGPLPSSSIKHVIMIDHRRAPNLTIGPELELDFTFAFMPMFPFGKKRWTLYDVHPPNPLPFATGMLVSQPETSSHTEAAILVFSRHLNKMEAPEFLRIFFAASTHARVKLCCRILENVRRGIVKV
jgi:hypothetical protein